MVDPVGTISFAASILSTCYTYGCEFVDAPQEARRLGAEVSTLAGLLVSVKAISSSSSDEATVAGLEAVLLRCQHALQDVSDRLKKHDPNTSTNSLQRLKKRARWPLTTETTASLVAIVERQKSDLSIALVAFAM